MAYKKEPFDKACVMEALHLRGSSIRKLDTEHEFGWSSKSVERGLRDGEVSPDLWDALGRYLNVEPDYLTGKYHRECENVADPILREIWKSSLKAERYPYILKQKKTKIDGKFLYSKCIEYILTLHDISIEQFNQMDENLKKDFQISLENAIVPVIIKYFPQNAFGNDTWPEAYGIQIGLENQCIEEPDLPEDFFERQDESRFERRFKLEQKNNQMD